MHIATPRRATFLVAALAALSGAACSDSSGLKNPSDIARIALRPGVSIPVVIHTQATLTDNGGTKTLKWDTRKIVRVSSERGKPKIEMVSPEPSSSEISAQLASNSGSASYRMLARLTQQQTVFSDSSTFVPLVAVASGDYT
jgi:hypothetical protein